MSDATLRPRLRTSFLIVSKGAARMLSDVVLIERLTPAELSIAMPRIVPTGTRSVVGDGGLQPAACSAAPGRGIVEDLPRGVLSSRLWRSGRPAVTFLSARTVQRR
jgi:hypothetical protein